MAPPPISLAASFPQNPKFHQLPVSRRLSPTVGTASPSRSVSSVDSLRAKTDLLRLISDQERGVRTQRNLSKREEITCAIDALAVHGDGTITTDSSLSCTWRMLWTTEKEQLFIIKNARLFGTETGDVLQVIDVEKGFLNNVITFPPTGVFFVRSKIEAEPPQRVNFRFTGAVLRGSQWEIPLPPFGQGWLIQYDLRRKLDENSGLVIILRRPRQFCRL